MAEKFVQNCWSEAAKSESAAVCPGQLQRSLVWRVVLAVAHDSDRRTFFRVYSVHTCAVVGTEDCISCLFADADNWPRPARVSTDGMIGTGFR